MRCRARAQQKKSASNKLSSSKKLVCGGGGGDENNNIKPLHSTMYFGTNGRLRSEAVRVRGAHTSNVDKNFLINSFI